MKTCVAMFLVFECDTIFFWDILAIPIELFFYKGEYSCGKYKYAFSSISQLNTQTNKKNIMKSLRFLRNQLNDSDSAKLAKDFFFVNFLHSNKK